MMNKLRNSTSGLTEGVGSVGGARGCNNSFSKQR
jgi:hypothetical protein